MKANPVALFERGRAGRGRVEKLVPNHAKKPLDATRGVALEESTSFGIFDPFPELRVGIFGKRDGCRSDGEAAAEIGFKRVAYLRQVHGTAIHIVREPVRGTIDGDGLITAVPNLALSVRWADCQNFVVYAPRRGSEKTAVLGVLHAGWRGLAEGAITAFFQTLQDSFRVDPKDTYLAAGPSLCRLCAVFTDPLRELPPHLHRFITGTHVDLQAAADAEILSLGVPKDHLERHPACTACHPKRYWTSRGGDREAVETGRARNYLVAGLIF